MMECIFEAIEVVVLARLPSLTCRQGDAHGFIDGYPVTQVDVIGSTQPQAAARFVMSQLGRCLASNNTTQA